MKSIVKNGIDFVFIFLLLSAISFFKTAFAYEGPSCGFQTLVNYNLGKNEIKYAMQGCIEESYGFVMPSMQWADNACDTVKLYLEDNTKVNGKVVGVISQQNINLTWCSTKPSGIHSESGNEVRVVAIPGHIYQSYVESCPSIGSLRIPILCTYANSPPLYIPIPSITCQLLTRDKYRCGAYSKSAKTLHQSPRLMYPLFGRTNTF